MSSLNKVILLGNLTREPELKKTPSGVEVTQMRLAVTEQYRDRQTGAPKEVVCFVDVSVWDKQAENCVKYLSKGSQVLVEGRLAYEEWKTQSGESRSKPSVRADKVLFLGPKKDKDAAPRGSSSNG